MQRNDRHPRLETLIRKFAFILLGGAGTLAAAAAPTQHDYLELATSPDGRFVAAVEGDKSPSGGDPVVRQLVIRSTDGKTETAVALPCGAVPQCWPSSPAWTPDGARLGFALRTPGSHARAVYQVRADGGGLVRLLAFDGTIQGLRYAKTGALAMLATAGATKELGATEAGAPQTGDLDAAPPSQRLAVLEPGKDTLRWVSRDGLFVYEYDWLPDARGFVGTAAPGDGDRNWWVAKLMAFDIAGAPERVIYAPRNAREQLAAPRVSPDGRRVAFIVGLMSDFGSTGGDIFTVPVAGGVATNLTPRLSSSATDLDWHCDGHLHATAIAGDQMQRVDFGDASVPSAGRVGWSAPVYLDPASTAGGCASGLEAGVIQAFGAAPEIQLRDGGDYRPLTHRNAALSNRVEAHSVSWRNDGLTLQGWLLLPAQAARPAGARLPMITWIHGGPAAASLPEFVGPGLESTLLDRGYAIFLPNPRGSFGQGDAFTQANVKDFGGGDLRDILSGVDAVIKAWPIDGERLGITGHSYGGFMTMWAVTQTNRFKAAVAGAGLANWQSYYGENDIVEWMTPYFGASVYADPAVYAKSSPINFITHVKTPVFSYVGEADIECPAPQTLEFGRALQVLGVPSSTLVYPGEGHAIHDAAARADIEQRALAWFDRYLATAR
jgi:dipeptidyl aminopeptidase/acylaminoacyl peptidase